MKTMTRILTVAAAAAAVIALVPSASANCIPAQGAATFGGLSGAFIYINQGTSDPATRVGKIWDTGNPATNSGTYPASEWAFVDVNNLLSQSANLGDSRFIGCPSSQVATLMQTTGATGTKFAVYTINKSATGTDTLEYNYANLGADIVMIDQPRPRVASSGRSGTTINLTVNIDALTGGLYGPAAGSVLTAVRIVAKKGTADPGSSANGFVQLAQATTNGTAVTALPVAVDCSDTTNDQWIATQLVMNGSVTSDLVSQRVRVSCGGLLADPKDPHFKLIDKKAPKAPSNQ